jgi:hypothetical protein
MHSIGERKVAMLLDSGDIYYEQEYIIDDLKSDRGVHLKFDFAVFEAPGDVRPKFLIEYQGEQHFKQKFQSAESFRRQQANDKRKRAYCNAKGLVLLAIPYTEYNAMTLESILEQGKFFD